MKPRNKEEYEKVISKAKKVNAFILAVFLAIVIGWIIKK